MEKEFVSLENASPVTPLTAFKIGCGAFFNNFPAVLKMCDPILYCALGMLLLLCGCLCLKGGTSIHIFIGIILAAASLFAIIAGAWRFLLARVAASYLAKDIFENQELKNAKEYYGYVEKHTVSYIKYWLWLFVVSVALCVLLVAISVIFVKIFFPLPLIIALFIALPFNCGAEMSIYYWAYGDKSKPLDCLTEGIKSGFKHFWSIFVLFLVSGFFFMILTIIIGFICIVFMNIIFSGNKELHDTIMSAVQLILFMFYYYLLSFIATRYYFSLIKKR